jgi:hypothetical protein
MKAIRALTYLSAPHDRPLLDFKRRMARGSFQKLYKSIGLFDRYLRQFAVFMEDVEHVPLGDSLGRKVACT